MLKVLVTGPKGFIGSKVIPFLKGNGYSVKEYNGDVRKPIKFSGDIDVILHLAALTSISDSIEDPMSTVEVNVLGTLNVLEFARKKSSKVVFLSTAGVYGQKSTPVSENDKLNPKHPYGESKVLSENLCEFYSQVYGIKSVVLRLFNIYGPGQKSPMLIPDILNNINGKIVFSSPNYSRDFVHLDDLLNAIDSAINFSSGDYEVFNIATGKTVSIGDVVILVERILNKRLDVEYTNFRAGEINVSIADVSKAKNLLGWEPKVNFVDGLTGLLKDQGLL